MKHQQATAAATPPLRTKKPVHAALKDDGARRPQADEVAGADGLEHVIRETAYSYYEARGFADGHDLEDWLKAEAEVTRSTTAATAASASH